MDTGLSSRSRALAVAVIALAAAVTGGLGLVGADARWLAAVGATLLKEGLPHSVPLTAASTSGWADVPALAQLVFHGLYALLGDRGLLLAQTIAVAGAFALLWRDARRHALPAATALILIVVLVAGLPSFTIARVQLFSLVLFPVLLLLLRGEAARPSRRVWLLLPLVALWSNLHGGVLTGVFVAVAYLLVKRLRQAPAETLLLLLGLPLALCLTPALAHTPHYYLAVLHNAAAARGVGMWAPLGLAPFDLLLAAGALLLGGLALRSRPQAWEWVALVGLACLTLHTARGGVWLLMLAAAPAARGLSGRQAAALPRVRVSVVLALVLFGAMAAGLIRGPLPAGAQASTISLALHAAHGRPVLAEGQIAEQVMVAGGSVLVSDPLDAFSQADQRLYLDWLAGRPSGDPAVAQVSVVLVLRDSEAARRLQDDRAFRLARLDRHAALYLRRP
jgi:hypothetical protein